MAKLSKSEMNRLLAEVTEDVAALLKSEAQETAALTKADPGMQAPGESTPGGSSSAPPAPEESSSSSSSSSSPSGEASFSGSADPSAAPMDGGTPAAGPGPEGTVAPDGAPAADPAMDAGATPEALEGEYMKLPPEELKMHLMAASSAYDKLTGGGAGSPPPAAPGPEASMSPSASAPAPEMGKGEYSESSPSASESSSMGKGEFDDKSGQKKAGSLGKSEEIKAIETRLAKAEEAHKEVETLQKALSEKDNQIKALEENINRIAAGVQKIVTRQTSMRKSVSGISEVAFIAKPGTTPTAGTVDPSNLTKSEITERLNAATSRKDLTKSDRDAINNYVLGRAPVDTVVKFLTT
jgi:hypothetical protein